MWLFSFEIRPSSFCWGNSKLDNRQHMEQIKLWRPFYFKIQNTQGPNYCHWKKKIKNFPSNQIEIEIGPYPSKSGEIIAIQSFGSVKDFFLVVFLKLADVDTIKNFFQLFTIHFDTFWSLHCTQAHLEIIHICDLKQSKDSTELELRAATKVRARRKYAGRNRTKVDFWRLGGRRLLCFWIRAWKNMQHY